MITNFIDFWCLYRRCALFFPLRRQYIQSKASKQRKSEESKIGNSLGRKPSVFFRSKFAERCQHFSISSLHRSSQPKTNRKSANGDCWRKNSNPISSELKEKRNEESFDTWCFRLLAFEFFVDVVKRQKASSRFFLWADIPDSSYHWHIYLTFIGGSVWIDSISKNSIIVVILGFRDDLVVSEVSMVLGWIRTGWHIKRFTKMSCQFWMKKKK